MSGWYGIVQAPAPYSAAPAPRHFRSDSTLIQENQVRRIHLLADLAPVRTSEAIRFGVLLGGVERLFFSRRSMPLSTVHSRDKLISNLRRWYSRSCNSASVRSACLPIQSFNSC